MQRTALKPRRAIDALIPDESTGTQSESPNQIAWRRLKADRLGQVSAVILLTILIMTFGHGWFEKHWAQQTANEQKLSGTAQISGKDIEPVNGMGLPNISPGLHREYTLGSDALGRDIFMRVLSGGRVSLTIAFGALMITTVLALIIGTTAGYYKGNVDAFISWGLDIMLSIPTTILMIAVSTSLASSDGFLFIKRGSISLPLIVLGVFGCAGFARIIRSQALSIAEKEFVEAARALGATNRRIIFKEVVPHIIPTIVTYSGIILSAFIIAEAGLSFLGIGVLPPTASWGNIISDGRTFYSTAWWICLAPGLFIALTVMTTNLVTQSLEDAFDPKSILGK